MDARILHILSYHKERCTMLGYVILFIMHLSLSRSRKNPLLARTSIFSYLASNFLSSLASQARAQARNSPTKF